MSSLPGILLAPFRSVVNELLAPAEGQAFHRSDNVSALRVQQIYAVGCVVVCDQAIQNSGKQPVCLSQ